MAHELHDFIGPHSKFWSIIHGPVEVETVLLATTFFFFFFGRSRWGWGYLCFGIRVRPSLTMSDWD